MTAMSAAAFADTLDPAAKVRAHLIFSGHVQGVGFRWNTQAFAEQEGVTGWVMNLPGGTTVEAEFQGKGSAVASLCRRLQAHYAQFEQYFPSSFEVAEAELVPWVEGETGFRVRYYPR